MTTLCTLGSYTILIDSSSGHCDLIGTQSDEWKAGQHRRIITPIGHSEAWTLKCYELDVDWAESVIPSLLAASKAGTPLTFILKVDEEEWVNTTVLITGVDYDHVLREGTRKRNYTLDLAEDQS